MHVKGLNGHQMLVLSPSFPSFISSLFLEEEKLQFRGNTLTKLPKTMHLPFKVDRKAKLQSLKRKVTLRAGSAQRSLTRHALLNKLLRGMLAKFPMQEINGDINDFLSLGHRNK